MLLNLSDKKSDLFFIYPYIEYICGGFKDCKSVDQSERQKLKALEIAKHRILSDFHMIGLKEHMEWSLVLLEYMLPYYFKSSLKEYNGQGAVRDAMQSSATVNKQPMTPEAEQFMQQGPLPKV